MRRVTVGLQQKIFHMREVTIPRGSVDSSEAAVRKAVKEAKSFGMPKPLDDPWGRTWAKVEHEVDARFDGLDPVVETAEGYVVTVGTRTWVDWTDEVEPRSRRFKSLTYDEAYEIAARRADPPKWDDESNGWLADYAEWYLSYAEPAIPRGPAPTTEEVEDDPLPSP